MVDYELNIVAAFGEQVLHGSGLDLVEALVEDRLPLSFSRSERAGATAGGHLGDEAGNDAEEASVTAIHPATDRSQRQ